MKNPAFPSLSLVLRPLPSTSPQMPPAPSFHTSFATASAAARPDTAAECTEAMPPRGAADRKSPHTAMAGEAWTKQGPCENFEALGLRWT